jgi:hypothetical protein
MYHTWRELTKAESLPIADCQVPIDIGAVANGSDERLSDKAKSAIGNWQSTIGN